MSPFLYLGIPKGRFSQYTSLVLDALLHDGTLWR
jgi:hypothetical protein